MLSDRVALAIRRHRIFAPGDRVLVGVSGGPDSVALLSLLRRLVPVFAFRLCVAHFNHGWRPAAVEDEEFTAALAARWGYRYLGGRAPDGLPRSEAAARTARYRFLREAADTMDCGVIAIGHTRDDQIETLLLHLFRGSGARGLAAMRHRRDDLARPLLDVSRADIERYLREEGITPRRDESNEDLRFARNRLRANVIPALERFQPGVKRSLARTASILAEEDQVLDDIVRELRGPVTGADTYGSLASGLQRRMVRLNRPALTFTQVEEARAAGTWQPVLKADGRRLAVRTCACDPRNFRARDAVGHVDAGTLTPPLEVLRRQPGDRVRPIGFPQAKRLQDLLVDAHVPRHLRDALPVVHDQRGIVWIPGVTVADAHRVTTATTTQWHLEMQSE